MSRLKLFLPLIIFSLLAIVFWNVLQNKNYDPQDLPSALIDQPLPSFTLPTVDTDNIVTEKQLVGRVFLLNVWATWCITCRVEHPYLVKLKNQGINIIGLNYKDDKAKAQAWLSDFHNPYVVNLYDEQGSLGLDLGVYGAPETYLIDAKGIIRYKHVGDINAHVWQEQLQPLYEGLLKNE